MSVRTAPATPSAPAARPAGPRRLPGRPGRRPGRDRRRSGGRPRTPLLSRAVANSLLIVVTFYMVAPITWLVVAGTKSTEDLFGRPGFEFGEFNLFGNIAAVWQWDGGAYPRWYLNSVVYSLFGSLAGTFISMLAGYAFDKYDFRGKEKLFGFVLAGVLLPATVMALPMYLLFSKVGLVNTYWAVLIPGLAHPFGVYLARVFSQGYVPAEVLEAARMDGAGELRIFFRVALPMLAPGFVTIFLFSFTTSWNNFFLPMVMLSDHELYPVTLGLFTWNTVAAQSPEFYRLAITGSLLAIVPLIVAFVMLQRFWRSGLTAGAVK
ncbi:carbohydrate ABC transporter permease [Actinomadura fulvescens]|uniref:Carbohydrate ABC transporter permease n=1 Tax=Actinomadura fulvescens TaxID=46160 RepID=A0ABN3QPI9_9ACTN